MSQQRKNLLILLGITSAVLIVIQLVLGQLILSGRQNLIKAHQHSGYTTVVIALVYLALSLATIAGLPVQVKKD
jgi:hypothetical protein